MTLGRNRVLLGETAEGNGFRFNAGDELIYRGCRVIRSRFIGGVGRFFRLFEYRDVIYCMTDGGYAIDNFE